MNPAQQQLLIQARTAYERGDLGKAKMLCEQLLSRTKKNAEALFILGQIHQAERQFDEAVRCFERSAVIEPRNPAVTMALANVLRHLGKLDPALRRIDKALKLKPGWHMAIQLKATILDARGDDARVRALLEPVVEQYPQDATSGYYIARCLYREGKRDEAIALLRRHRDGSPLTAEQRRRLSYQLGQWLERAQDYDGAIEAFHAANGAEPLEYDPDAHRRHVDELIETYSAPFLAGAPRAGHGLDQPVLIVGMPRTGSTLLEQILDRHLRVAGAGESMALWNITADMPLAIGSTQGYPACVKNMNAEDAERLGRTYVDTIRKAGRGAARVVDKNLANFEHLGFVSLVTPQARVLDCRRNPWDNCLSCYASDLDVLSYAWATDLTTLGLRYRQYERLMEHWHAVLDLPMLRVQYEDLVDDQEGRTREVLEFLGLPWDDRCLRFHESSRTAATLSREQVKRPMYRSSMGRAERYGAHLDPLREALATEV
ncbi:MAG: tetratricopeptide repeat protein [Planctomycetes bacterium]|nr:tetratricopeptide repeat protein [Planctomycetota bacterium]